MIASLRAPRSRGAGSRRSFYGTAGGFRPERLGLRAVYDYRLADATGFYDQSGNGLPQATVGGGSNSPLWLPYAAPSVYVPASNGNGVVTGAVAGLIGASELDIRIACDLDSWPSGSVAVALSQGAASGTTSAFRAYFNTTTFRLDLSDGTATFVGASFVHGRTAASCLRFTWRSSDGRVQLLGKATTPQTALADMQSNSGWTQIGVDATLLVGSTLAPGVPNCAFGLGAYGTTVASPIGGKIYGGQIAAAIDGTPIASFDPATCTQSGNTDPQGNPWFVIRQTSGRQTIVQSPAAGTAHSASLLGLDDWVDVPALAVPALDTYAAASSIMVIHRRHTNTSGQAIFATKNANVNTMLGMALRTDASNGICYAGDGGALVDAVSVPTLTFGAKSATYVEIGDSSPFMAIDAGGTVFTDTGRNTVATTSTGLAGRIGAFTGGAGPISMELYGFIAADRRLTISERAQIRAFYGATL